MSLSNKQSKIFLLFCTILIFTPTYTSQQATSQDQATPQQATHLPYTIKTSSQYLSSRQCGFIDKNLYINNGTYQEIGFYSNQKFSLFVETDERNISITGFAIASKMSKQSLDQLKKMNQKMFKIERYKQIVVDDESDEVKGSDKKEKKSVSSKSQQSEQQLYYYANLTVYGVCRTASVSTIVKDVNIEVTYLETFNALQSTESSTNSQQTTPNQFPSPLTQTITIPTAIYCIDGVSIKQANYFVSKLYSTVLISIIGLLLYFKPLKKVHFIMRVFCLSAYIWIGIYAQTLFDSLIATYCSLLLLVVFYRLVQEPYPLSSRSDYRQTIVSKSYILVSIASALPLAIKSHLQDETIDQKKITLYLINFIMLSNTILFVSSIVNLTRFRHAFYYFLALVIAERYFGDLVANILAFNFLKFQVFPAPYQCQSLFFAILVIPLCDFFFKSYSSQTLYKFIILLVPILAHPLHISYSAAFAVGMLLWVINGRLNGLDLIKIIKFKK